MYEVFLTWLEQIEELNEGGKKKKPKKTRNDDQSKLFRDFLDTQKENILQYVEEQKRKLTEAKRLKQKTDETANALLSSTKEVHL